jgi:hypothetical protein
MRGDFKLDFIGVGAAKCGTYWVTECLREHPKIRFSKIKEINFFNKTKGIYGYDKRWNYEKGISWYKRFFPKKEKGQILGEMSVDYLYDDLTPRLIKKHFPNVKIIICLRNPIDRTYSSYCWYKSFWKEEKADSFEEALKSQSEHIKRSLYYSQLKRYYDVFPNKNIHIILLNEIKENPKLVIKKLYKFLNVDDKFIPESLNKKINSSKKSRINFFIDPGLIYKLDKIKIINSLLYFIKRIGIYSFLRKLYVKINFKTYKYPKMKKETRIQLKKTFKKDIERVEKLINRDLSFWK